MNTATLPKQYEDAQDFLELWGTDYVEFYVGNAKPSAYYFKTAFGFQEVAYAGLETGVTDRTSYVLQQDKIRLVITSSSSIKDNRDKSLAVISLAVITSCTSLAGD